jgi:hypothetical protein
MGCHGLPRDSGSWPGFLILLGCADFVVLALWEMRNMLCLHILKLRAPSPHLPAYKGKVPGLFMFPTMVQFSLAG